MEVYNLLIIFLLLCTLLSKYKRLTVFLLSLISVSLIYIAANRGLSVGTDTLPYYWDFMNVDTENDVRVASIAKVRSEDAEDLDPEEESSDQEFEEGSEE